jgi:signal-transduction protein with cAMP-binding, CBS, and nucleotidyltransferase domain
MFSGSLDIHAVLSSALAFHRLSDEGLVELADLAEVVPLRRGQALFREGSHADAFYVIASGCVELSRRGRGGAYREARLSTGESMGLETLTTRVWGFTAAAQADSVLVSIPAVAFSRWAAQYPEIKISLELDRDTRRLARDAGLDFLQEDETVFFIARKHPIFLFGRLIAPVLLAAVCVFAFAFLYFSPYGELPLAFPAAGLLLGCSVLWFVWNLLD